MREPAWRKTGSTPDYRFSLANETTFLAWIRTSLALIVGALGIDQLFPDIAPAPLRISLCVALAVIGAVLAGLAYRRWGQMEAA
ncbi:YidH family protein, partial [Arthrobacter sp. SO3]|uniref:YidH family protein n=1 Tax=Arthrobacter sp. SO3 TaxID=1897057 RepID=UPI001CFFA481